MALERLKLCKTDIDILRFDPLCQNILPLNERLLTDAAYAAWSYLLPDTIYDAYLQWCHRDSEREDASISQPQGGESFPTVVPSPTVPRANRMQNAAPSAHDHVPSFYRFKTHFPIPAVETTSPISRPPLFQKWLDERFPPPEPCRDCIRRAGQESPSSRSFADRLLSTSELSSPTSGHRSLPGVESGKLPIHTSTPLNSDAAGKEGRDHSRKRSSAVSKASSRTMKSSSTTHGLGSSVFFPSASLESCRSRAPGGIQDSVCCCGICTRSNV